MVRGSELEFLSSNKRVVQKSDVRFSYLEKQVFPKWLTQSLGSIRIVWLDD